MNSLSSSLHSSYSFIKGKRENPTLTSLESIWLHLEWLQQFSLDLITKHKENPNKQKTKTEKEKENLFLHFMRELRSLNACGKVWVQFIPVPRIKSLVRIARREGCPNSKSVGYSSFECTPSLLPKLPHFAQVTTSLRRILNRNPPRTSTSLFVSLLSSLQEQQGVCQAPQTHSENSKTSAVNLNLVPFL